MKRELNGDLTHTHKGGGFTYFAPWGFSINEGGGPANIHVQWGRGRFFFYLYLFGLTFLWPRSKRAP